MNTVYSMGVNGERFLMVFNVKRNGWEMPGGTIEAGETPVEAAIREFREESGLDLIVESFQTLSDCYVCVGRTGENIREGEMRYEFFEELPSQLSFSAEEYRPVLKWGWHVLGIDKN